MKVLLQIFIILIFIGCRSESNEVVIKDPTFNTSISTQVLDANIKNDERIQVDFKISYVSENFSHIEIVWEHRLGLDTFRTGVTEISAQNFKLEDDTLSYSYFKDEEFVYNLFFSNLDSLTVDSEFELTWTAYDEDDLHIASNQPNDLSIDILCDLKTDFLVGEYLLESESGANASFGEPIDLFKNDTVLFTKGSSANERQADVIFYDLDATLKLEINCGKINTSNESIGVSCGNGIVLFSEEANTIDVNDDNKVTIDFIVDYYNDCGITERHQIILTRIK